MYRKKCLFLLLLLLSVGLELSAKRTISRRQACADIVGDISDCRKILALDSGGIFVRNRPEMDCLEYYRWVSKQAGEARDKKDYRQAEKLFKEFIVKFKEYPAGIQEMWKNLLKSAYYDQACCLSLLNSKSAALDALATAIRLGWHNYSHALQDSDLDFIRDTEQFKELMASIRSKGDYLYILQQSGGYVRGDEKCAPLRFTYMNPEDENLKRVRRYFNLDSIAGDGDEISRIKNLMRWVHHTVRHDGSSDNPVSRNAIDMVELCRKENRGINCRMMAQILNECYLAMGFKSRFVTCMPETYESDCHVINVVYSDSLRKWVWMDPTFEAWVTDENGLLLGIAEVRERLKKNLPLILNKEANWNYKSPQTKEKYLDAYMAKNLYYVNCYLRSEYNAETDYPGKEWPPCVTLIPQGYRLENKTSYVTCDDEWFWQLP